MYFKYLVFCLLACHPSLPSDDMNNGYPEMWAEVEGFEKSDQPRSALEVVEKIYEKSRAEGVEDEFIKSVIYRYKLTSRFSDLDPAEYIGFFIKELELLDWEASKALMHSLLGELYQQYGLANMHRIGQRTAGAAADSISMLSLEEILDKSVHHYNLSINTSTGKHIRHFDAVLTRGDNNLVIHAENLDEFLLFRALEHFKNDQSFITRSLESSDIDKAQYMQPGKSFLSLELPDPTPQDYKLRTLHLFKKAINEVGNDQERAELIDIDRLEYLYHNSDIPGKDSLFLEAMHTIASGKRAATSQLAYIKIIEYYLNRGERYGIDFDEAYKGDLRTAYRYIQKAKSEYENGIYKEILENQQLRLNRRELEIQAEAVVPIEAPFPFFLAYRNIQKVYFTLYRLDSEEWTKYHQAGDIESRIKYLREMPVHQSWEESLKGTGDFNRHATEFLVDGLEGGRYILMANSRPSLTRKINGNVVLTDILVSDLSYLFTNRQAKTDIYITNRITGDAVEGAKVTVFSNTYDYSTRRNKKVLVSTSQTDPSGLVTVDLSDKSFTLVITKGRDTLDLSKAHYNSREREYESRAMVHFFTDRAIYRPGQTVFFKALLLRSDGQDVPSVLSDQTLEVILKDVNWQTIEEKSFKSNRYGSINGSFRLPDQGLTGAMRLEARLTNGYGSRRILVEEYKRPKVKMVIDTLSKDFVLGDSVQVSGTMKTYSGVGSSRAEIRYTIYKTQYMPWYGRGVSRIWPPVPTERELVDKGVVLTNENGGFDIHFNTEKGGSRDQVNYEISLEATDITGESVTAQKVIQLSETGLIITADIPERAFEDELASYPVIIRNSDGKKLQRNLNVRVVALEYPEIPSRERLWTIPDIFHIEEEGYSAIPGHYPYRTEQDIKDWPQKRTVMDRNLIGDAVDLSALGEGAYRISFTVQEGPGQGTTLDRYLIVSDKDRTALPVEKIWISEPDAQYVPGDLLNLTVSTPFEDYKIFYRMARGRELIRQGWLDADQKELSLKITETLKGGFGIEFIMVRYNRVYRKTVNINVPWIDKRLDVTLSTFRDNLEPGAQEKWTVEIGNIAEAGGEAEILASMYDASLDRFASEPWTHRFFPEFSAYPVLEAAGFGTVHGLPYNPARYNPYTTRIGDYEPSFNWFGFSLPDRGIMYQDMVAMSVESAPRKGKASDGQPSEDLSDAEERQSSDRTSENDLIEPGTSLDFDMRENLNEMVFFYPDLVSRDGKATIDFTMNEALTTWKFRLLAHNAELATGYIEKEVVTSKKLMIEPFLPRFVRQGDEIVLTARISNQTPETIETEVSIEISDFLDGADLSAIFLTGPGRQSVQLHAGQSQKVEWPISVPDSLLSLLKVTMKAQSSDHTDGEVNMLPVITNRKLVTESKPFYIEGGARDTIEFSALDKMLESSTLVNHGFTVELTSNPTWFVLKALPALYDGDIESTDGLADAYYAIRVGQHLAENPQIRKVLQLWQEKEFESPLLHNEELKSFGIENTPWLSDALREEKNMRALSLLADRNFVSQKSESLLRLLGQRQTDNGGFAWFPGGRDNWYISQYILEILGRLSRQGLDATVSASIDIPAAVRYGDERLTEYYEKFDTTGNTSVSAFILHYIYVRQMYPEIPKDKMAEQAHAYFYRLLKKDWNSYNSYQQALLGEVLVRDKDKAGADRIFNSLKERMVINDILGNYWNDQAGYYWYQANVAGQSQMIEFFRLMDAPDEMIGRMMLFLLLHKQVNSWETSRGTAAAVYTFMSDRETSLEFGGPIEVYIPGRNAEIDFDNREFASGYGKHTLPGEEIDTELSAIVIDNKSEHLGWGAVYWQYFEVLDEIDNYGDNPLKLSRELYRVTSDDDGELLVGVKQGRELRPGDKIRIRITLQVDRQMGFLQMTDMRASGTEPLDVISSYKYRDGLSYYESPRDQASHFYFENVPKGNYVFEYDVFVSHKGNFSAGVSQIQSYYAPSFGSHSKGSRLNIEDDRSEE